MQIHANSKERRGILIGRMQPLHNGHIQVIKDTFKEVDELIIGIGSTQISHTLENPFTAGERTLMVKKSLTEEGIEGDKYYIIPITDIMNNAMWVSHVEMLTPYFNKVFSGNPLVQQLFTEAGYELNVPVLFNRKLLSGTKIRDLMINDGGWEDLVPKSTAMIIKKINGVERLKHIYR
ncbi:MAG: nicotinamide-nucleotide adenylyltransferase [Methanobrevibacter sp.]|jgi:nicotinamide-nucleotide adenylyltransferase|nr:nicotinamide-nucleotide adenylyltransferase [Candidatus Methanovirga aequatorialis]